MITILKFLAKGWKVQKIEYGLSNTGKPCKFILFSKGNRFITFNATTHRIETVEVL